MFYKNLFRYPLCRKFFTFLGFKRKYCLSCGEEGRFDDHVNYFHCQNSDCTGKKLVRTVTTGRKLVRTAPAQVEN